MRTLLILGTELVAVAHLSVAIMLFIYARRSVAYLAQAWITLLTFAIYAVALAYIVTTDVIPPLGMLHPVLLCSLLVISFLQSINPLGMVMPGYLQMGRMVRYAAPAAGIVILYLLGVLADSNIVKIHDFDDLQENFLSGDVLLRLASLLLSSYYIVNIILLPHRLIRRAGYSLPNKVVTYATLLGFVQILFVAVSIWFSYAFVVVYEVLFTAVSLMLTGFMTKALVVAQPYPQMHVVETPPTLQEISEAEQEDFNAANLRRFESIEYAMQSQKPFLAPDFTRDSLCRACGFNRHIVLQTLRSQGYNDVHDYISRYRVSELRRMIEAGEITDVRQHERVGFRTLKTAVLAFERYEHVSLADFVARHNEVAQTSDVVGAAVDSVAVQSDNGIVASDSVALQSSESEEVVK